MPSIQIFITTAMAIRISIRLLASYDCLFASLDSVEMSVHVARTYRCLLITSMLFIFIAYLDETKLQRHTNNKTPQNRDICSQTFAYSSLIDLVKIEKTYFIINHNQHCRRNMVVKGWFIISLFFFLFWILYIKLSKIHFI